MLQDKMLFLLLTVMVAGMQMVRASSVIAPGVQEDFPFHIRVMEMKTLSDGSVVYDLHFVSRENMEDQSPWGALEALQETFPFEALYGDVSWTRCAHSDDVYVCTSTLKVHDPTVLVQGVGVKLRSKTDQSWFYFSTVTPNPRRDLAPKMVIRPPGSDTTLTSHPPRQVHFEAGDDVTMKWEFTVRDQLVVTISRQSFTELMSYQEIAMYYREIDTPSKSLENMEINAESDVIDEHQTRYVFELIIRSTSATDVGLYQFRIGAVDVRTELMLNGRNSIFGRNDPLILAGGCMQDRRLISGEREFCLHCIGADENIQGVDLYHGNEAVAESEGHIYQTWDQDEGLIKAYYVVTSPTPDDAGEYRCDVTLNDNSVTSATTQVFFSETALQVNSFEVVYHDGLKMILRCDVTLIDGIPNDIYFTTMYYDVTRPMVEIAEDTGPYTIDIQPGDATNRRIAELMVNLTSADFTADPPRGFYCYVRNDFAVTHQYANNPMV